MGSDGDETGICGRCDANNENCAGSWDGICASGQTGAGQSVCTGFDPYGQATAAGFWDNEGCGGYCERQPCFTSQADGTGLVVANTTCVRELCEGSGLCGGYMLNAAHTTLYLSHINIHETSPLIIPFYIVRRIIPHIRINLSYANFTMHFVIKICAFIFSHNLFEDATVYFTAVFR